MSIAVTPYLTDVAKVLPRVGRDMQSAHAYISDVYDETNELALSSDECDAFELSYDILGKADPFDDAATWPEARRVMVARLFEIWCAHEGRRLSDSEWSPTRFDYLLRLDQQLAAAGATTRVTDFAYWGLPQSWPPPEEYPLITWFTPALAAKWLAGLNGVTLADPRDQAVIDEAASWMRAAVDEQKDLVTVLA